LIHCIQGFHTDELAAGQLYFSQRYLTALYICVGLGQGIGIGHTTSIESVCP